MFNDVYQKALQIINYSPQTELTLMQKLLKKNLPEELINQVIEQLKESNLIDDLQYAHLYTDELIRIKFTGPFKIIHKLLKKGIDKSIATELANNYIEKYGGEEEIIKRYIEKNMIHFQRLYQEKNLKKIQYKLSAQGFKNIDLNQMNRIFSEMNFE